MDVLTPAEQRSLVDLMTAGNRRESDVCTTGRREACAA